MTASRRFSEFDAELKKAVMNTLAAGARGGQLGKWVFGPEAVLASTAASAFAGFSTAIKIAPDVRRSLVANANFPYAVVPKLQFSD
ncbi:MAG: hypothetical protein AAF718_09815 [Pseudomonadota bacterium]